MMMVDEAKVQTDPEQRPWGLDTTYRCDRCGAQAYTEATMKNGLALYFCKHHGDLLAPSLGIAGAVLRTDHKLMAGLHG